MKKSMLTLPGIEPQLLGRPAVNLVKKTPRSLARKRTIPTERPTPVSEF
jgi:hypothetical protein